MARPLKADIALGKFDRVEPFHLSAISWSPGWWGVLLIEFCGLICGDGVAPYVESLVYLGVSSPLGSCFVRFMQGMAGTMF